MTTNLEALLERATKRPWDCGSSADGQLTEIAVNHFEEAIRTLRHIVHTKHFRENMEPALDGASTVEQWKRVVVPRERRRGPTCGGSRSRSRSTSRPAQ